MLEQSQAARGGGTVHEEEGHLWCKQLVVDEAQLSSFKLKMDCGGGGGGPDAGKGRVGAARVGGRLDSEAEGRGDEAADVGGTSTRRKPRA